MTDTLHTWITAVSVQLAWAPAWAISLALVLVFGVAAIVIHTVAVRIVRRRLARHDKFWSSRPCARDGQPGWRSSSSP
jgi:uncharacterized protein involved in outer membrane biogenesis